MRRFRIIGLALVAVFALAAVAASSASAAAPEFVPANGKFPVSAKFTSGVGVLEAEGGHTVTCEHDSGAGEIASAKELKKVVLKFTGCTTNIIGKDECKTKGKAKGEIVTNTLAAKLVFDNPEKTSVALLVANEKGPAELYAEFECLGLETIKVKGSVLVLVLTLNTSTELIKTSAKQTGGEPEDTSYWNEAGTELLTDKMETKGEGFLAFGYVKSGITGTGDALTEGTKVEVKS
jgi:hypothetical protein